LQKLTFIAFRKSHVIPNSNMPIVILNKEYVTYISIMVDVSELWLFTVIFAKTTVHSFRKSHVILNSNIPIGILNAKIPMVILNIP
jgi:hypothetical protein